MQVINLDNSNVCELESVLNSMPAAIKWQIPKDFRKLNNNESLKMDI